MLKSKIVHVFDGKMRYPKGYIDAKKELVTYLLIEEMSVALNVPWELISGSYQVHLKHKYNYHTKVKGAHSVTIVNFIPYK